jgi:hypothetical protein
MAITGSAVPRVLGPLEVEAALASGTKWPLAHPLNLVEGKKKPPTPSARQPRGAGAASR